MSLFIGIDSGTQSVKAVVLDLDTRKVIAEARAPHTLIDGLPVGHMEQHPQEWTAAMDNVILEVAAKIDRQRVRGSAATRRCFTLGLHQRTDQCDCRRRA